MLTNFIGTVEQLPKFNEQNGRPVITAINEGSFRIIDQRELDNVLDGIVQS